MWKCHQVLYTIMVIFTLLSINIEFPQRIMRTHLPVVVLGALEHLVHQPTHYLYNYIIIVIINHYTAAITYFSLSTHSALISGSRVENIRRLFSTNHSACLFKPVAFRVEPSINLCLTSSVLIGLVSPVGRRTLHWVVSFLEVLKSFIKLLL